MQIKNVSLGAFWGSILVLGLCGPLNAQCSPDSDPNCFFSLLPPAPPPPPTSEQAPLSPDTAIKTAYNIVSGVEKNPSGEVMDVAIAAISVGYPPAGVALGLVKGLFDSMSGGSDPTGQAIKQINANIATLNSRVDQLAVQVDRLQTGLYEHENSDRSLWLKQVRDSVQLNSAALRGLPTANLDILLTSTQQDADKFLSPEFEDLWRWNDFQVHVDSNGSEVKIIDADFKLEPSFDLYAHALGLWMAALQYASKGEPTYITRDRNKVNALLKHAAFLSVRPNWSRLGSDAALTLPEQVLYRTRCSLEPAASSQYPDPQTGMCRAQIKCADLQQHALLPLPPGYGGEISWRAENPKTDMCTYSMGKKGESPADAPELALAGENGLNAMAEMAAQLRKLAKQGTLAEQFVGQFDMTFYSEQALYGIKPNGELLWYGDQIAVDKNGPPATLPSGPPVVKSNPALTEHSLAHPLPATPSAKVNTSITAASGTAFKLAGPRITHKLEGPKEVANGWQNFRSIIPAGHASFYALAPDGSLVWYRHDGFLDGSPKWKGPQTIATGWNVYKRIFGGGDGILYFVGQDGSLNWYRRLDFDDPTPVASPSAAIGGKSMGKARAYEGPIRVAAGWGDYVQVFSGGEGIIYATTTDGRLLWFQHPGYMNGQPNISAPKQVGTGWTNMKFVFSTGAGVIYRVTNAGELLFYQHNGYKDGSPSWQGPTSIAADWSAFAFVFPRMVGTPQMPVIH